MFLNPQHKKLITDIDDKVKTVLINGGNEETLLVEMLELMPEIKMMLDSTSESELEIYYERYEGFYHYMKLLEKLAMGIADGTIKVP